MKQDCDTVKPVLVTTCVKRPRVFGHVPTTAGH